MANLKTTLEIPDTLFREMKMFAAKQGVTIRTLVNKAIAEKLQRDGAGPQLEPAWKKGFGGLRHLRKETSRINQVISEEFSRIDEEAWK